MIVDHDLVLLVERGREPAKGYWSLPGGALEVGEFAEDAVRRETLEETGLTVRVRGLVQVFERIISDNEGRPEYHYVLLDYLCQRTGGELRAGDDASRVRWVDRHALGDYPMTEGTIPVIHKAFGMKAELP